MISVVIIQITIINLSGMTSFQENANNTVKVVMSEKMG